MHAVHGGRAVAGRELDAGEGFVARAPDRGDAAERGAVLVAVRAELRVERIRVGHRLRLRAERFDRERVLDGGGYRRLTDDLERRRGLLRGACLAERVLDAP